MQVKKFEASNMQEALKLVKREMGPDAVILGAREISKGMGLLNSVSIEITAAVSENTLRKKKFVESRFKDEDKEKFNNSSAPIQKKVIDRVVDRYTEKVNTQRKQITSMPYISIQDDEDPLYYPRQQPQSMQQSTSQPSAQLRSQPTNRATQNNSPMDQARRALNSAYHQDQLQNFEVDPLRRLNGNQHSAQQIDDHHSSAIAVPRARIKSLAQEALAASQNFADGARSVVQSIITSSRSEQTAKALAQNNSFEATQPIPQYPTDKRINSSSENSFGNSTEHLTENKTNLENMNLSGLRNEIARLQGLLNNENKSSVPSEINVATQVLSAHPGASYGLTYDVNFMFEKLVSNGVDAEIAAQILRAAQQAIEPQQLKKRPVVDAFVARWILENSLVTNQPLQKGTHLFFGPNGGGKTSSIIKMASHLAINKRCTVAILTTDTSKVGAADQLRIFCKILNVPFAIVRTAEDWSYLKSELKNVEYLLCDFPGLQMNELGDVETIRSLLPNDVEQAFKHLVLPVTMKDADAYQMASRYKHTKFNDFILTNLDQSLHHGMVLNLSAKLKIPVHSFGVGSRIPEDFELATKERILDLIFRLSKLKSGR